MPKKNHTIRTKSNKITHTEELIPTQSIHTEERDDIKVAYAMMIINMCSAANIPWAESHSAGFIVCVALEKHGADQVEASYSSMAQTARDSNIQHIKNITYGVEYIDTLFR